MTIPRLPGALSGMDTVSGEHPKETDMNMLEDTLTVTTPASVPGQADHSLDVLTPGLLGLIGAGAGFSVATLYYNQPLLGVLGTSLGISDQALGWMPTLTQLGYALGILFLAPLGDRYDRRTVIIAKAAGLIGALTLVATAHTLGQLLFGSLLVGLTATIAQDFVPAVATLAPEQSRGRMVGTVMTGLLLGILLSRVVSGFLAARFGWRWTFAGAAFSITIILAAVWKYLPRFRPTTTLGYGSLLATLKDLWRRHQPLRKATLAQGLLAIGFSAFWSTLAMLLHAAPFHLGSAAAGSYGLAGAAGAVVAPMAGRVADRKGTQWVASAGATLTLLAFMPMLAFPWLTPHARLWLLGISAVGFDLGVQSSLIAHQTLIYGLEPDARSRLNAVLFVGMFLGMAIGSALATNLYQHWGWQGVIILAVGSSLLSLVIRRH
jgi:predicted MFS family arabinose efflux permease